jgi:hypothetical protein
VKKMADDTTPLPDDMLRGMPKQMPCAWCGKSRADQVNVCFSADDETPLCDSCWTQEYGGPADGLSWIPAAPDEPDECPLCGKTETHTHGVS